MAQPDFPTVLQQYRNEMTKYKAEGDLTAKGRAETLKQWLDTQLQTSQEQLNSNAQDIQSFIQQYAGSTSDIEGVRREFQEVRERGPALQDVYDTDTKRRATEEVSPDYSYLYTKSALVVGLFVVAFVVARRT
jgi:hypothetical protein